MKNKLALLGVLFGIFGIIILYQIFSLKFNKEGTLEINSSPEASVFLDNNLLGKTPFSKSKLKEGEYSLKLVPENVATTTASWSGKVQIISGKITSVDRELGGDDPSSGGVVVRVENTKDTAKNTGQISIETEPSGAIIYLDSEEQKTAPHTLMDVALGDHEIAVFSPGFFRRSQKITIEKTGDKIVAEFKLAVDPTYKKVEVAPIVEIEGSSSAKTTKKTESTGKATATAGVGEVLIKDTPTGWLRVRKDASATSEELAKVDSGTTFKKLDSKNGWVEIEYATGKQGWVSAQYVSEGAAKPKAKAEVKTTQTPTPTKKP